MITSKLIAPTFLGVTAAAQSLPDPNNFASIGWVSVTLVAIIIGLNQVFDFYKKHIREQPIPADTYLTIRNWDDYKKLRHEEVKSIQASLDKLEKKLDEYSSSNYNARRELHKKVNAHSNTLHYMAGQMARGGDEARRRLIAGDTEGGES